MNAEKKDNGVHTWIDLLNNEEPSGRSDGGRIRGVKISSRTPRGNRTASRLTGHHGHGSEGGQAEGLRAQVMSLLKDKQELRKKMEAERNHRQRLEMELAASGRQGATRKNPIPVANSISGSPIFPGNGLDSSSTEMHLTSLQEALNMSAKEKRVLEEQLQRERLQADQLRSGLSEIENKMRANRQRAKEKENHCAALEEAMCRKSEQLDSMRGSYSRLQKEISSVASQLSQQPGLAPLAQQLERLLQESTQWVGTEGAATHHLQVQRSEAEKQLSDYQQLVLELRGKVSALEDQLARLGSERDALKERLGMVESQRQFAVTQYQEEVEARMLEVTSQLEELLQLNQQLQKELMSSQNEREVLMESLQKEMNSTKSVSQERDRLEQALSSEQSRKERADDEMAELRAQISSRQATVEELQARLRETRSSTSDTVAKLQGKVHKLEDDNRKVAEAQHQLLTIRLEKDQLIQQLGSSQNQCNKLRGQHSRLEREGEQLRGSLGQLQQEKTGLETELVKVQAELKASEQRCSHYQNEIRELREFSQTRSRQQVEHLTQQLVDSARKLEEALVEKRELQSRIKKLEGKLHEMALASEVSSSQLQKSMRTMATDFDSTLSDLERSRSESSVLKKQVSELEMRLAETRQHLMEREQIQKDLQSLLQERTESISKLEATVSQMREESSQLAAASLAAGRGKDEEAECLRSENRSLVSQIQSLTNTIEQSRTEKETLAAKLSVQLEKVVAASRTEQSLREENSKLQELLSTTIDLSERLQSSLEQSQLDSSSPPKDRAHALNLSDSLVEVRLTPDSLSPGLLNSNPLSGESPPLPKHSSSQTEVLHLQEKLAQTRQSCLKLEAIHASDQTQLAKAQGSLQALTKIQEHLNSENKSLTQAVAALEKDREELRREWQKATIQLETVEADLAAAREKEASIQNGLAENLSQMADHCQASSSLHASLLSHADKIRSCLESSYSHELSEVLCTLFSSALEHQQEVCSLQELSQGLEDQLATSKLENDQRRQQIASLESRCSDIVSRLSNMEQELEAKERKLKEKEDELAEVVARGDGDDASQRKMEGKVKDMETQYQAKLTVLRESLVAREQEVASLQHEVADLQDGLSDAQHSLFIAQEELEEVRRELHASQSCLAQTEGLLRSEAKVLEEESNRVASETAALKAEAVEAREGSELTQSVSAHQQGQAEATEERIVQLRGEVEMLRARKTVLFRYLHSQNQPQDDSSLLERDQLVHESEQLMAENESLRAKLQLLAENSHRLQEEVESLVSQLASESGDVPFSRESELALREEYQQQLDQEVSRVTMEVEAANSALQRECAVLETELETERLRLRTVEGQKEAMAEELGKLRHQLRQAEASQSQATSKMTIKIAEQDASLVEVQSLLQQALSAKQTLERRLIDMSSDSSLDGSLNTSKKVDKLRAKLKQQIRQTNHLRMKLGYALSELRLYKQLKQELDNQISQLQEALSLSQDQYRQCIRKLENAEQYTNCPPRNL